LRDDAVVVAEVEMEQPTHRRRAIRWGCGGCFCGLTMYFHSIIG
jgi:hypothetical protein